MAVYTHHGHGVVTTVRGGWVLRLAEQDSVVLVFHFLFAYTLAENLLQRGTCLPGPRGYLLRSWWGSRYAKTMSGAHGLSHNKVRLRYDDLKNG